MEVIDWKELRDEHQAALAEYDIALTIIEARLRAHTRPSAGEALAEHEARMRLAHAREALHAALLNEH